MAGRQCPAPVQGRIGGTFRGAWCFKEARFRICFRFRAKFFETPPPMAGQKQWPLEQGMTEVFIGRNEHFPARLGKPF
jgi:hypothetical protein